MISLNFYYFKQRHFVFSGLIVHIIVLIYLTKILLNFIFTQDQSHEICTKQIATY